MAGAYVGGWAIALPSRRPCAIEIINETGQVVASGSACLPRTDLAVLGHARTDFAFRIPVGDLDRHALLTVTADGEELPGSPLEVGPGVFDGHMTVSNGHLIGWVSERTAQFLPPTVTIRTQDGELAGHAYPNVGAAAQALPLEPAQFSFEIPDRCYRKSTTHFLAAVGARVFVRVRCAMNLVGAIDRFRADRVTGWLLSPEAPQKQFLVQVWRDGKLAGEGKCCLPQAGIQELYPQSSSSGFDIPISGGDDMDLSTSVISLRLPGSTEELLGGPFTAAPRAAIIAAARELAQAARNPRIQFGDAQRTILQAAMTEYVRKIREGDAYVTLRSAKPNSGSAVPRLTIIIPVYRDVVVTEICIKSVLRNCNPATDRVIIINDASPDVAMGAMLHGFTCHSHVAVVTNESNQGFVKSVNYGLSICAGGDVVIMNSDARLFPGALDRLVMVANGSPEVGTVTPLSNNATIFSYPDPSDPCSELDDVSWEELARVAMAENADMHVDVPTAHGFCMLIRRVVLDLLPNFDEVFGHGYGEENEFCLRAADLGFRHVAAAGVLVEHVGSVSFGESRSERVDNNLRTLSAMFPEYISTVRDFEHHEELRRARWPLDTFRLGKFTGEGGRFAVVVENWLGHGTQVAVADIENAVGYGTATKLRVACDRYGKMILQAEAPKIRAVFAPGETAELFRMLAGLRVDIVVVHQLIGFSAEFIDLLGQYLAGRNSIYHLHDFFPICPRATMLDASGQNCRLVSTARCSRCIEIAGAHSAARLDSLPPDEHRDMFYNFLIQTRHIVAPSRGAAACLRSEFPDIHVQVIPHPQSRAYFPAAARRGDFNRIVLIGAIGPHKGSGQLLDLARLALLTHPHLHFHVVGFTDIDDRLNQMRNVTISGAYSLPELPRRLAEAGGRIALFLHGWAETFSYTLTEAVSGGLLPLVPDLGAPAERVRDAGFGVVFPYPINSRDILEKIDQITAAGADRIEGSPLKFATPQAAAALGGLMGIDSLQCQYRELRRAFDGLARAADNPFVVANAVASSATMILPASHACVAREMGLSPHTVLREALPLLLLDPKPTARQAAAAVLRQIAMPETFSPTMLRRARLVRNWLPGAELEPIDLAIRRARRQGVACAHWAPPQALTVQCSMPDGAGAQTLILTTASGRAGVFAGLLLAQDFGIRDAWCDPARPRRDITDMLRQTRQEMQWQAVGRDYLDLVVQHHIARGWALGHLPQPAVLEIAETVGAADWKGRCLDVAGETERLFATLGPAADAAAALQRSGAWLAQVRMMRGWFDGDAAVRGLGAGAPAMPEAEPLPRREAWAERLLLLALWLRAGQGAATAPERWQDCVVLAQAVLAGRPLPDLPAKAFPGAAPPVTPR